jgi:hypothetical protein
MFGHENGGSGEASIAIRERLLHSLGAFLLEGVVVLKLSVQAHIHTHTHTHLALLLGLNIYTFVGAVYFRNTLFGYMCVYACVLMYTHILHTYINTSHTYILYIHTYIHFTLHTVRHHFSLYPLHGKLISNQNGFQRAIYCVDNNFLYQKRL